MIDHETMWHWHQTTFATAASWMQGKTILDGAPSIRPPGVSAKAVGLTFTDGTTLFISPSGRLRTIRPQRPRCFWIGEPMPDPECEDGALIDPAALAEEFGRIKPLAPPGT